MKMTITKEQLAQEQVSVEDLIHQLNPPALKEELDHFDKIQNEYKAERDLVNQLIGRVQMADGIQKLVTVSSLRDLQIIKDRKLYKALGRIEHDGKVETVSTFDDFCRVCLGVTADHINEKIRNLQTFGEQAISAMNRIGLGYRDLRKLRKLPESDQTIIIDEIQTHVGDKESIVDLITTISSKHQTDKQVLEQTIEKNEQDKKADAQLIDQKNQKIDELTKALNTEQPQDQAFESACKQFTQSAQSMAAKEVALVRDAKAILDIPEISESQKQHALQLLAHWSNHIITLIKNFEGDFGIYPELLSPVDQNWMKQNDKQIDDDDLGDLSGQAGDPC